MLEKYLRLYYQKWMVERLANKISSKIAPNSITFTSIFLGIFSAILLVLHHSYWAVVLLLLSGYLDTLDGTIARLANKISPFGSGLDIVGDRIVEFAIIFGLYLINPAIRATTTILMLGSILFCISSFLVVGIFTINDSEKSFHYSSGLIERFEAFIFFIAMILVPQYFNYIGNIFALLVALTAFIRMYEFKKQKQDGI
jgi:archaetidylinositol phosphate synthase